MKKLIVVLPLLGLLLCGCGAIALGVASSASSSVDKMLKLEYAQYVIDKQKGGVKNRIDPFVEWFDNKYGDLSNYGTYYNLCKLYPKLNESGPLDYTEWAKINPRP